MLIAKIVATLAALGFVAFMWWPAAHAKEIKHAPGPHLIGLTREQIARECGTPRNISHQIIPAIKGVTDREQWVYENPTFCLYLTNGVSDSIQYEDGQSFYRGP